MPSRIWARVISIAALVLAGFVLSKYSDTDSPHLHGLVLASAGAILLAIDPILKIVGNLNYRHLANSQGAISKESREALRNLQIENYLEHSWIALASVLLGTVLLAVGFYLDFNSEVSAHHDTAAHETRTDVRGAPESSPGS